MKKIFIPVLVGLLAASCSSLYHPQLEAIPLVEEQGELSIETGLSHQDAFAGNISVAYGLTDRVALSGFARTSQNDGVRNFHGQVAAGLYDKTESGLIREAYVGFAAGMNSVSDWGYGTGTTLAIDMFGNPTLTVDNLSDDVTAKVTQYYHPYTGNYQMGFVQGNIGKRWEHFEWALGVKLGAMHSLINHTLLTYSYTDDNGINLYDEEVNPWNNGKPYNNFSVLLQPQFELRFGWEHFKFTWRIAYGMQFGLPSEVSSTFFGKFNSGLGIHYRL